MLPSNHVIWLDDLDRYLGGGGLTAGLVMRLAESNAVVATLRAREWDRFQPTDLLRPPEWDALSVFEKVTLDRDRDRPNDEDLARAVPDVEVRDRISRIGIGEYVGSGQHIVDRLSLGAQAHPLGYALVCGAVDWWRTGVARPVPASLLPALASARLNPRQRTTLATREGYSDSLAWATREINPTVALLEPGDGVFTVYDFALDRLTTTDDAPTSTAWQIVIDNAEPSELVAIGYQAEVTYGDHDVAERAWRQASAAGHTGAMTNLGILLKQLGNLAEAVIRYRQAANNGDTRAVINLGALLRQRGDLTEAESWYQRAADSGDCRAMFNLGLLLAQRGNLTEAGNWYQRAANSGDSEAMFNLGLLLERRGDPGEIIINFQQRAGTIGGGDELTKARWAARTEAQRGGRFGESYNMYRLGLLLTERGDLAEAENWYRRAAWHGDKNAMNNLGVLLKLRGNLTEAEIWYQRAADTGEVRAMVNLGTLMKGRGDLTKAKTWWRRAVQFGNREAMKNLGDLLERCGDLVEAEALYRRAANTYKDEEAMFNVGCLMTRRGDLIEAETWYRRAADKLETTLRYSAHHAQIEDWCRSAAADGDRYAMLTLASLLLSRRDLAGYETWYQRATADGCTTMRNHLEQRGDLAEAETWYRRAADDGHSGAMFNLGLLLEQRGDLAEAETWYRQAAMYYDNNAMNNLGLLLEQRGNLAEAETWYRRAADDGHSGAVSNLKLLLDRREAEAGYQRADEYSDTGPPSTDSDGRLSPAGPTRAASGFGPSGQTTARPRKRAHRKRR